MGICNIFQRRRVQTQQQQHLHLENYQADEQSRIINKSHKNWDYQIKRLAKGQEQLKHHLHNAIFKDKNDKNTENLEYLTQSQTWIICYLHHIQNHTNYNNQSILIFTTISKQQPLKIQFSKYNITFYPFQYPKPSCFEQQNNRYKNYLVMYKSIFNIRYQNLKKLRIIGPSRQRFLHQILKHYHHIAVLLLRVIHCRYIQIKQTTIPLQTLSFQEDLSLKNILISDAVQVGQVLSRLSNSKYIEDIDLTSSLSPQWVSIAWILKLGYVDAQQQAALRQVYPCKWGGGVLQRIDIKIGDIFNRTNHMSMIRAKFNNRHLNNPLAIW